MADDNIQHGIDDDAQNDAEKGAALGGLGGAAVGAIAGAAAGPVGAVVGAIAGGLVGAGASGAAVGAVDKVDNDNTVTGLGDDGVATYKDDDVISDMDTTSNRTDYNVTGTNVTGTNVAGTADTTVNRLDSSTVTGIPGTGSIGGTASDYDTATNLRTGTTPNTVRSGSDYDLTGATSDYDRNYGTGSAGELSHDQRNATEGITSIGGTDMNADVDLDNVGNGIPGVQTGGSTTAGQDTRGITEKAADTLTGDRIDDKTGGVVLGDDASTRLGNNMPGVQTGGTATDGTPDTRGVTEKAADAITGDKYDDNTGKRVDY